MHNIKIVIGANAGDEGKGLVTDYFARQAKLNHERCIVVLHNGGAQRGHTVTTQEGKRHVFHHFGSGTFVDADTYCDKNFIINPIIFHQEYDELNSMIYKFSPIIYIHTLCQITTPFDMIVNQIIEEHRGSERHGSCGLGIYETIKRGETYKAFCFGQLFFLDREQICIILKDIRDNYVEERLRACGIETIPDKWMDIIYKDELINHFIEDLFFMKNHSMRSGRWILPLYQTIIFENGQGLLLDQNNLEYYPHLTPSNTGIQNPLDIIKSVFKKENINIEACYVTRTYITRHGAGRLDNECIKDEINPDMQDMTNMPNPHQGTLRYGKIDLLDLGERIVEDSDKLYLVYPHNAISSLAITHINEYKHEQLISFRLCFERAYCSNSCTEIKPC